MFLWAVAGVEGCHARPACPMLLPASFVKRDGRREKAGYSNLPIFPSSYFPTMGMKLKSFAVSFLLGFPPLFKKQLFNMIGNAI